MEKIFTDVAAVVTENFTRTDRTVEYINDSSRKPDNLTVIRYDYDYIVFACRPWGGSAASFSCKYHFYKNMGEYRIAPLFHIAGGCAGLKCKSEQRLLVHREIRDIAFDEFITTMQESINTSFVEFSKLPDDGDESLCDFTIDFRNHKFSRVYEDGVVRFIKDGNKSYTITPCENSDCVLTFFNGSEEEYDRIITKIGQIK